MAEIVRVWNGETFRNAGVFISTETPLLETDPLGPAYWLPTGLLEDPNHPGLYFADGLERHDTIAGLYKVPYDRIFDLPSALPWTSPTYDVDTVDEMIAAVRYHALVMGG